MQGRRGMFIVFEGLDRSGKSTQATKLAQYLTERSQGEPCLQINYPNRQSQSGQLLDQYLKNKTGDGMGNEAVHLLFCMNRWEMKNELLQRLGSGQNIVCDRYAYSGVAYSAAKQGVFVQGLDFEWCLGGDRGLVMPDLVIYFDIGAEALTQRGGFGEERFERVEFQKKVEEAYVNFKSQGISSGDFLAATELTNRWVNIEIGSQEIDSIHSIILEIIAKYESTFQDASDASQLTDGLFK